MARNIMVSDKVYEDLKEAKGKDKSFSEVIAAALEGTKRKTLGELIRKHAGVLKGDTEYDDIMKWSKERWRKWRTKPL